MAEISSSNLDGPILLSFHHSYNTLGRLYPPGHLLFSESIISVHEKLYRSKRDRILAGVCAGLGEHFDIDPVIIRLVWVALTLLSIGIGVIVYIVAWIIIPEQTVNQNNKSSPGTNGI